MVLDLQRYIMRCNSMAIPDHDLSWEKHIKLDVHRR